VRQHTKLHAVSFFRNIEHDIDHIAAKEYTETNAVVSVAVVF